MRSGRTGGHDRMIGSLQTVGDRHIAGCEIDEAAGNEERRDPARSAFLEHQSGFRNPADTTDARSDHDAGRDLLFIGFGRAIRIRNRLMRRAHRIDDERVDLALLLRLHPIVRIVSASGTVATRNHAGDLRRQIGHVERIDLAGSAFGRDEALPGGLDPAPERCNHSQSGNDNTSHHFARVAFGPSSFIRTRSELRRRPETKSFHWMSSPANGIRRAVQ